LLWALLMSTLACPARAEDAALTPVAKPEQRVTERELRRQLVGTPGTFQHYAAALWLGKGLRFNNPYRLSTPLGDSYESVSATATYVGLMLLASFGKPAGLEHGASLQLDYALDGVRQEVLTPSYVVSHVLDARVRGYGRFGLPIVLEPDLNLGAELGVGAVFQVWAGIGATAELIGSLFYGAATLERSRTAIPIVSLQLGARVDYEVLP
jgi:hypothetical protein